MKNERAVRALLNCWVQFVVLREAQGNDVYLPLLDCCKELMDLVCEAHQIDGQKLLDEWQDADFNIEELIKRNAEQ